MYQYHLVEGRAFDADIGEFTTYGLELYEDGKLLCRQTDVSVDRQFVLRLADLLSKEQVEPVHMMDVILNMLP